MFQASLIRTALFGLGLLIMVGSLIVSVLDKEFGKPLAMLGFMVGVALMIPILMEPISAWFNGFFYPTNLREMPAEMSQAKAMMANHDYANAAEALRRDLAAKPNRVEVKAMLVRLLMEQLGQYDEALTVAMTELRGATEWHADHEQLVLAASDMASERGQTELAVEALERGLRLKKGSGPEAATFQARLNSLRGNRQG